MVFEHNLPYDLLSLLVIGLLIVCTGHWRGTGITHAIYLQRPAYCSPWSFYLYQIWKQPRQQSVWLLSVRVNQTDGISSATAKLWNTNTTGLKNTVLYHSNHLLMTAVCLRWQNTNMWSALLFKHTWALFILFWTPMDTNNFGLIKITVPKKQCTYISKRLKTVCYYSSERLQ